MNFNLRLATGLVTFMCVCLSPTSYSQNITISPAPTAASLGSYITNPVSFHTGKVQFEVPLYVLSESKIRIPFSLSYNSNGIKVEEVAGWTGLGWTLQGMGFITRSVSNIPDDFNETSGLQRKGYLYSNIATKVNDFDVNASEVTKSETLWWDFHNQHLDSEPDIFYFSFGSKSGKFVFDKNKQPKLIPYENLNVQYSLSASGQIIEFRITDDDGSLYIFNAIETSSLYTKSMVQVMYGANEGGIVAGVGYSNQTTSYNSSWFLSKIIDPLGKEIIFNYENENYSYDNRIFQEAQGCTYGMLRCGQNTTSTSPTDGESQVVEFTTTVSGKRLSSVETSTLKLDFKASHSRQDLPGTYAFTSLDVYSKSNGINVLVKKWNLSYDYYLSPGGTSATYKRLKLIKVNEAMGSLELPPYTFNYNSIQLPDRFSKSQDLWGFYNGSNAQGMLPTLYVYPNFSGTQKYRIYPKTGYTGTTYVLPGSDRLPNGSYMKAGILEEIIYPTGGKLVLEYEPHQFVYDSETLIGGGIRIKRSTFVPEIGNPAINMVKNYYYTFSSDQTSSGKIMVMPSYCYILNGFPGGYDNPQDLNGWDYYNHFLMRTSANMANLTMSYGSFVGYKEVTEEMSQSGKSIYRYSLPGSAEDANDCDLPGIGSCRCNRNNEGFCDELYLPQLPRYVLQYGDMSGPGADTKGMDFFINTYPFAPNPNYDWNRGVLLYKKDFDNNGNLVKEVNYTYKLLTKDASPTYVYGLKLGFLPNVHTYSPMQFYVKYPIITEVKKVIESITQKEYDRTDFTKSVSTLTEYSYSATHLNITEKKITNSDGNKKIIRYKYPKDYLLTGPQPFDGESSAIITMATKGMNDVPLEVTEVVKESSGVEKVIGSALKTYSLNSQSVPLPYQEWELELGNPVTDFSPSSIIVLGLGRHFVKDSRYSLRNTYKGYDSNNNLLEALNYKNVNSAFQWGYDKTLPIVETKNANASQVAYNGAESGVLPGEPGWENGNGTSVVSVTDANDVNATYSGNYAIKIDKVVPGGINFATTINITPNPQSGKYRMSCWVKTPVGYTSGKAFICMYSNKEGYCCGNYPTNAPVTNVVVPPTKGSWQYIEAVIDFDAIKALTTDQLMIRCYSANTDENVPVFIDEVRISPIDALMKTYSYKPLVGLTSITDENNSTTRYEYDEFNRLKIIRDNKGKILKKIIYHYGN